MLGWLRSFLPSCTTCQALPGTNWTCPKCRENLTEKAQDVVASNLPVEYKGGLLLLGAGAVLAESYFNPIPYREVLLRQQRERASLAYQEVDSTYNTSCTVCLEDFASTDTVLHTPCKHTFHTACLAGYDMSCCPNCRQALPLARG